MTELLLNIAITGGVFSAIMWFLGRVFVMDQPDNWFDVPISLLFLLSVSITVIFFMAWVWVS